MSFSSVDFLVRLTVIRLSTWLHLRPFDNVRTFVLLFGAVITENHWSIIVTRGDENMWIRKQNIAYF